jgi:uncharacterized Fe-S cluster protein YjdI
MASLKKKYTKDLLTVVWQPELCIHSEICFKGLPEVFNPAQSPWVNLDGSNIEKIRNQVRKCPSGALSFEISNVNEQNLNKMEKNVILDITENGPILINGPVHVKYKGKEEIKEAKTIALCRCGFSTNKPYCDGSHRKEEFQG